MAGQKKLIIASDHAGFMLKENLKLILQNSNVDFEDLTPELKPEDDYPDIAFKAAKRIARDKSKGVLICGSGIGMCIAANKIKGIRAAVAYDELTARLSRQHNDTNVLCLGARTTDEKKSKDALKTWLSTRFLEGRHKTRVEKIREYEK